MIKCMAIDDEPLALQQLATYIGKVPYLQLAAQCQSAIEAKQFLEEESVDAIFCDINMPDLSGMDFVRSLAAPPIIVFTTAYAEYAIEGYKVDAADYLLKPFGLNEFMGAAEKVKKRYEQMLALSAPSAEGQTCAATGNSLFLKTDYRLVRISVDDIRYIEGMSEYVKIYFDSQKPITALLSMKKLEEQLPTGFMRIHRSYIINLQKIQEVNKNRVVMAPPQMAPNEEAAYLPIGDLYRETLNNYISSNFLGKA